MALIRGTVLDAVGRPVGMAAVYVMSAPIPQPDIAQISAADGTFTIAAPVPGTYVVGARSDDAGQGSGSIAVGDAPDQELTMRIRLA